MKPVQMRFGGYSWKHNPRELKVEKGRKIRETVIPFDSAFFRDFGEAATVVKGEGELFGEDCLEQFFRLRQLFKQGKVGVLSIPKTVCMKAVFSELEQLMEPMDNALRYAFVFCQVKNENETEQPIEVFAEEGQTNLWDIADQFETDIHTLIRLNPQIKMIDEIEEGERIRIC